MLKYYLDSNAVYLLYATFTWKNKQYTPVKLPLYFYIVTILVSQQGYTLGLIFLQILELFK